MKRLVLLAALLPTALFSIAGHAKARGPLGSGHLSLKLSYLNFTDDHLDSVDDGGYLALEVFGRVARRLYIGGELGAGGNVVALGHDVSVLPIEASAKYVPYIARNLVVAIGAGAAICRVSSESNFLIFKLDKRSDFLFGGQLFVDLAFVLESFTVGLDAKCQITQDFEGADWDASTFRIGIQLGYVL